MKLQDYIHYYLGCYGVLNGRDTHLIGAVADNYHFIDVDTNQYGDGDLGDFKPVLRRLSAITEEEVKKVAGLCYGDDDFIITYSGMGYVSDGHNIHDSVRCYKMETFSDHPLIKGWIPSALLQLDIEETEMPIIIGRFSNNGKGLEDDCVAKPFELTHYLLQQKFDLFGLIDVGLAFTNE